MVLMKHKVLQVLVKYLQIMFINLLLAFPIVKHLEKSNMVKFFDNLEEIINNLESNNKIIINTYLN